MLRRWENDNSSSRSQPKQALLPLEKQRKALRSCVSFCVFLCESLLSPWEEAPFDRQMRGGGGPHEDLTFSCLPCRVFSHAYIQ